MDIGKWKHKNVLLKYQNRDLLLKYNRVLTAYTYFQ